MIETSSTSADMATVAVAADEFRAFFAVVSQMTLVCGLLRCVCDW